MFFTEKSPGAGCQHFIVNSTGYFDSVQQILSTPACKHLDG